MADTEAQNAPKPPPNLRVATDEAEECDSCAHYQRGKCALYNNLPVDDEWVCDSYKKGGQDDTDEPANEAQPSTSRPQPKNLREAERAAYIQVRAHRRSAGTRKANSGIPDAADRVK